MEIVGGWVDLAAAAAANRASPDLNPASPGRPYLDEAGTGVVGQWVWLVFRTDAGRTFTAVGLLEAVEAARLVAREVVHEGGDPAADWFVDARWTAILERGAEGGWSLVELEEMADPDDDGDLVSLPTGGA